MNGWSLVYESFEPEQEKLREALCTLGNGYFATRGASCESSADNIHYPGTYLAGGYNRLKTEIQGRVIENEDLVNFPNWLPLTFRCCDSDDEWFDLRSVEILQYRQELDLKRGLLLRTIRFRDTKARESSLSERRLVHMRHRHVAALELRLKPENWSGTLLFRTGIDGSVINDGVPRYRKLENRHLEVLETDCIDPNILFLKVQTNQSEIRMAQAARTEVFQNDRPVEVSHDVSAETERISSIFATEVSPESEVTIEKVVSVFSSRDQAISECGLEARAATQRLPGFTALLESHVQAWAYLWHRLSIDIEDHSTPARQETRLILHLHKFHLLVTVSPNTIDSDASVPARGLHGEAYRGHIFWDELFIFPILTLSLPEIARALLKYRYRRLARARIAARNAGYRGAMFPWQSGSNGREESQTLHLNPESGNWIPDNTHLQRHINSAIAYNVWRYFQATEDLEFLSFYGAELMLEIARFWASIATYDDATERYEICGVMGPDEYHDSYPGTDSKGLNNNAYTNIMAVWVLRCGLDIMHMLPAETRNELRDKLDITEKELEEWESISKKMKIVFHDNGIISQFEGYADLEEFDWEAYREKYDDIQRLDRILEAEGDSPNRYKLSKQADVLMLFYLFSADELRSLFHRLGYEFKKDTIPRTIEYYARRTSHGSTLSRVVYAWVLARSDRSKSWYLFRDALESDLTDIQGGTTPEGIHLGAMAGTIDLVQRCYTGIQTRGDTLWFDPYLPEKLGSMQYRLRYRGHELVVNLSGDRLRIVSKEATAGRIRVGCGSLIQIVEPGAERTFPLKSENG